MIVPGALDDASSPPGPLDMSEVVMPLETVTMDRPPDADFVRGRDLLSGTLALVALPLSCKSVATTTPLVAIKMSPAANIAATPVGLDAL